MTAETVRVERSRFARGHVITLATESAFRDATGVGHDPDGRKSLAAAWRDLARNSGRTIAALKALPRVAPYLRIRR